MARDCISRRCLFPLDAIAVSALLRIINNKVTKGIPWSRSHCLETSWPVFGKTIEIE